MMPLEFSSPAGFSTAPTEADRHRGLSQLILDLKSPGVTIRPIINLAGEHDFNEIVLDRVFVQAGRLVGKEGDGWRQVTSELAFERSGLERFISSFQLLVELMRRAGPDPEPQISSFAVAGGLRSERPGPQFRPG